MNGTSIPVYDPETDTVKRKELEEDTILLSKDMEHPFVSLSKPRFTLMHECAHHLLHTGYFRHKAAIGSGKQVAYSIQKDKDEAFSLSKQPWTDDDRLEWQANYFASALLMPESRVERVMKVSGWQEEYFRYVMAGYSERSVFHELVRKLSGAFGVSPRMAEIRLEALKFERLPDLRPAKPDSFDCFPLALKKKRMTKEEREWERAEIAYERHIERKMEREVKRRYVG